MFEEIEVDRNNMSSRGKNKESLNGYIVFVAKVSEVFWINCWSSIWFFKKRIIFYARTIWRV